jgi:hypothetical protein
MKAPALPRLAAAYIFSEGSVKAGAYSRNPPEENAENRFAKFVEKLSLCLG